MLKKARVAARTEAKSARARRAGTLGRRKSIARYCAYAVSEMQDECGELLAAGGDEGFVATAAAADIDAEALDFLVERGERDHEALGGFGLVPVGALEHVDDDAALDFVHDLEERRLTAVGGGARAGFGRQRQEFRKLQAHAADDFLAADGLREQVDVDALLRGKNDGTLHDIFEFADVAGPIVVHQELHSRGSEMAQGLGIFLAVAVEEMREQRGNIFAAVAQRRQLQMNDVEAVIEILAEAALADEGQEIDVRGGDDAHVDFDLFGAAEAHELALLNDAEELGLRFGAYGGDFVEEDGALVGNFEEPFLRSDRAGESAFDVAEKLGLEEVDGNGAGVNGNEGFVGARGGGMNGLGDELFASAAFAADQDGGTGRRDLGDEVEQREHLFAFADDVGEIEALLEGALELHVFFAQAPGFHSLRDLREEFVVGPGLGDVVHGAALEGRARHVDGAVRGDQNDGEMRIAAVDFFQEVEAVAVGKANVQQQQIEGALFELGEARFGAAGAGNAIAFAGEEQLQALANFRLIVHYQDRALRHGPLSPQRGTRRGRRCLCQVWSVRQFFQHAL